MIQIYLVIALVFAVVTGGGALYIKSLRAENAQLTQAYGIAAQTAIDNKAALEAQLVEAGRVNAILLTRDQQRRAAEKRTEVLNGLLDNLKRDNQSVRDWSDTAVPDPVLGLLNGSENPGEDGSAEAVPTADAIAEHADPVR